MAESKVLLPKRLFPILESSPGEKQRLAQLNRTIDGHYQEGRVRAAEGLRQDSVRKLTILLGPWACDFTCPNYCYTKGTGNGILTVEQTIEVIRQARGMGVKLTYWPGEGELTLLRNFWDVMGYQQKIELPAVVFSNGSIFHNDSLSQRVLGVSSNDLVKMVTDNQGLHFYIKYWHSDPAKAAEMAGVRSDQYLYETMNGTQVPLALARLLQAVPTDRLGVEVMVSRENYDDVVANILPLVNELGIYGYVEPVIFSGNARDRQKSLGLTPQQKLSLQSNFASGGTYCEKRQSTELIVKGSKLTPGIAIPPRTEDTIIDDSDKILDIFSIFHNHYFVAMRRKSEELAGCLCRAFWDEDHMRADRIRTLFGRFAPDYQRHMETTNHTHVQASILNDLAHHLRGAVLDIATGTGTIARLVRDKPNVTKVYAVDYSPEMIEKARKISSGIVFEVRDVTNLPYANQSFDTVTCSYGFYWFNMQHAVKEIKRVLKEGGTMILLEEEFIQGHDPKPRFAEKDSYLLELAKLETYTGIGPLKQLFQEAGFSLIDEVRYPVDDVHDTIGMVFRKKIVF